MNNPPICIGITCFNEGRWLEECWESVLAQTDKRWIAIMVLDGDATDETRTFFYQIEHENLRKISLKKNIGPYLCRTLAILNSTAVWYAHLDADDLLPENAIELIQTAIRDDPEADFVFGDSIHFNDKHQELRSVSAVDDELFITSLNLTGTSPIKRKIFFDLGGYAPELLYDGADWDFWISMRERNAKGCRADGVIYKRRQREKSVGANWGLDRDRIAQKIVDRHPNFFFSQSRKEQCLGKANELIARTYKTMGKRKLAAEYAKKAIKLGYNSPTLKTILEEERMNYFRYFLRRLGRKL